MPNISKWNLYIRAYREDEAFSLNLNKVVKPGRYELNLDTHTQPSTARALNYGSYEPSNDVEFVTTSQHTDYVQVTKADTITGTVSGTFEFTAVNRRNPSKTIRVTKGRFDVCTGLNCK